MAATKLGANAGIADRLLAWHAKAGRHDLPWQKKPTPYRVWVSEIMLQQTQVATVIPYYQRFMQRFPNLKTLAVAPIDTVLHNWTGLGYYARARNLHVCAQLIMQTYNGRFPRDIEQLMNLPGIGRSTAGAILALANNQPYPILDGNAKRVLARFHAVGGWPGKAAVAKQLWACAGHHTPAKHVATYTQAIMDLGATVCTRSKPACHRCPLQTDCAARQQGRQMEYPGKKVVSALPVRHARLLIFRHGNHVLLERRPPAGIWGGLWSFPETSSDNAANKFSSQFKIENTRPWPVRRHTFSHFHLDFEPVIMEGIPLTDRVGEQASACWYDLQIPPELGLAAPVKQILNELQKELVE